MKGKILQVNPLIPEPEPIQAASHIMRAGGLVIFPTTSLYGIGVDAFNEEALEKIFTVKGREKNKPILILADSIQSIENLVEEVPPFASVLMQAFWPGCLTLIFKAKSHIPKLLAAGSGKIGIRVPGHPVALALVREMGSPITGTSANLSNQVAASHIEMLSKEIYEKADLILDSGHLQGGVGSTVLDVTHTPPKLIREGSLPSSEIFKTLR